MGVSVDTIEKVLNVIAIPREGELSDVIVFVAAVDVYLGQKCERTQPHRFAGRFLAVLVAFFSSARQSWTIRTTAAQPLPSSFLCIDRPSLIAVPPSTYSLPLSPMH